MDKVLEDDKWEFNIAKFWDFTDTIPQQRPSENWFCERNISGPSFPEQLKPKKRRPLRMFKASETKTNPPKPELPEKSVSKKQSVFDRLARSSTISSSNKQTLAHHQEQKTNEPTTKKHTQNELNDQHELLQESPAYNVHERVAILEKAIQIDNTKTIDHHSSSNLSKTSTSKQQFDLKAKMASLNRSSKIPKIPTSTEHLSNTTRKRMSVELDPKLISKPVVNRNSHVSTLKPRMDSIVEELQSRNSRISNAFSLGENANAFDDTDQDNDSLLSYEDFQHNRKRKAPMNAWRESVTRTLHDELSTAEYTNEISNRRDSNDHQQINSNKKLKTNSEDNSFTIVENRVQGRDTLLSVKNSPMRNQDTPNHRLGTTSKSDDILILEDEDILDSSISVKESPIRSQYLNTNSFQNNESNRLSILSNVSNNILAEPVKDREENLSLKKLSPSHQPYSNINTSDQDRSDRLSITSSHSIRKSIPVQDDTLDHLLLTKESPIRNQSAVILNSYSTDSNRPSTQPVKDHDMSIVNGDVPLLEKVHESTVEKTISPNEDQNEMFSILDQRDKKAFVEEKDKSVTLTDTSNYATEDTFSIVYQNTSKSKEEEQKSKDITRIFFEKLLELKNLDGAPLSYKEICKRITGLQKNTLGPSQRLKHYLEHPHKRRKLSIAPNSVQETIRQCRLTLDSSRERTKSWFRDSRRLTQSTDITESRELEDQLETRRFSTHRSSITKRRESSIYLPQSPTIPKSPTFHKS